MNSCESFATVIAIGEKLLRECPYYAGQQPQTVSPVCDSGCYTGTDVTETPYDFIITAFEGEPSARKIILPFRSDLVERLNISFGDIVTGRPTGAGCPVQHVIRVIEADPVSGLITGHVVGPAFARINCDAIDLGHYHMIGFEGVANVVRKEPEFGCRMPFLPALCMMHRTHTGLVNMIMHKSYGIHVRVEGIVIL
ncbi:hypothetical protein McpCs1_18700 [Methanocorpusculaceae archaeon Cs1]|uniref:Uncharacterized protein n=2 Tax=Methanorbis rubei TaxID=3028300 RepID=A0AAE4MIH4_9EURY|nr:hypothetical protein [Methanocorpusculaceae archaeon Cs1]